MTLDGYVRVPKPGLHTVSDHIVPPTDVADGEDLVDLLMLRTCIEDRSADPMRMMEMFVLCDRLGVYPPAAIMAWLRDAFVAWTENEGKESIDALLGLKAGRGETPLYKSRIIKARNEMLHEDMGRLIATFACEPAEAATMVAARLDAADWNKTLWDVPDLKASSILDLWMRCEQAPYLELGKMFAEQRSPDARRAYLSKFPPESVPPRLL